MSRKKQVRCNSRIVVDGRARIYEANIDRIRKEVKARFAKQLASASLFGYFLLRWRMRREIRRELERIAPNSGLYNSAR